MTHNTAILGILGVGKTYLALDLCERMMAQGIKVLCLDLTDQYAGVLTAEFDADFHQRIRDQLNAARQRAGQVAQNKSQGGSISQFCGAVRDVTANFLSAECLQSLIVLNPSEFRVDKQTTNPYQGQASFVDLTPAEITAIFSDAALRASQALGMTPAARLCMVYEEAHTLVPEWNSVASEGDRLAVAASARAILQGRKFGLGCLLVTQRTANVTKTILNQCNTIFAMRTFDDTGREFLGNYIGDDYAKILPSLQPRHAVLFGKASTCADPVLIRLNDRL